MDVVDIITALRRRGHGRADHLGFGIDGPRLTTDAKVAGVFAGRPRGRPIPVTVTSGAQTCSQENRKKIPTNAGKAIQRLGNKPKAEIPRPYESRGPVTLHYG